MQISARRCPAMSFSCAALMLGELCILKIIGSCAEHGQKQAARGLALQAAKNRRDNMYLHALRGNYRHKYSQSPPWSSSAGKPAGAQEAARGNLPISDVTGSVHHAVEQNQTLDLEPGIIGFWHLGKGQQAGQYKNDRAALFLKQLDELKRFPMFGRVNIRFLADPDALNSSVVDSIASQPGFSPLRIPAVFDKYKGQVLYEFPTLFAVWSHCLENPNDKVFYFHTKTVDWQRQWWQHNLFFDVGQIIERLGNGSWIYTPSACERRQLCCLTPGNFWWARCDHVRGLNNPFDPEFLKEPSNFVDYPPTGRYRAEWWILNDFLGPRPEPVGGTEALLKQRLAETGHDPDVCVHPKHGNLCSRVSVAKWNGAPGRGKPQIVPWARTN